LVARLSTLGIKRLEDRDCIRRVCVFVFKVLTCSCKLHSFSHSSIYSTLHPIFILQVPHTCTTVCLPQSLLYSHTVDCRQMSPLGASTGLGSRSSRIIQHVDSRPCDDQRLDALYVLATSQDSDAFLLRKSFTRRQSVLRGGFRCLTGWPEHAHDRCISYTSSDKYYSRTPD
jgi:hypothetical protein